MNQGPKKQRKILFLITKATWGGAQRYVYDIALNLPKDTFAISVAYGERGSLSAALLEHGTRTYHIDSLSRDVALLSDIRSFFQILRLLRREQPDILHLNSSKAAALGALAGRLAGVPRIVFTAHGWPFKEDRNFFVRGCIYALSWFTALLSHATIVVSKRDETIGEHMFFVASKIHYVPLGISAPAFLSRDEAWAQIRVMATIENQVLPRIVCVGELTTNKGHRYAIDAIAHLRDMNIACNLFLIGSGELREELEERAIEREVETRVYFLGFVENASRLLSAFDIFLLPSLKEGMPYVLLEAAMAKLPIISTEVVDTAHIMIGLQARFVPPRNSLQLASAIERSLEDAFSPSMFEAPLEPMIRKTVELY